MLTFFQKLKYLFSPNPDERKLKYLFGPAPDIAWTDEINFRTWQNNTAPRITIAQMHEVLTKAIADGKGDRTFEIEVEYIDGLLCGPLHVPLESVHIDSSSYAEHYQSGYLVVRPAYSLVKLHQESFRELIELQEADGPPT